MSGKCSIVATPIGNLDDMTFRAVKVLKDAQVIAAEDTRRAKILLQHFDIHTPVISYHMHNENSKTNHLADRIEGGDHLALLSDAGTPCISDPGFLLVRELVARGIEPEVIPGASALTYVIVACGFPAHEIHYGGFLPPKKGKRQKLLQQFTENGATAIVYESPFRITKLLEDIVIALGEDTAVCMCREATKVHEEHIRGTAAELLKHYKDKKWKGEFAIAISNHPSVVNKQEE
ncbi:MAG: 16S rRNA (cytidine(1402)-2'-O)-methyltransferase [Lentisphaeria bacterium]|nr:16S rRNA (cytidine(1402)-2'-O)-methyltransferase [Lentisphaeria bacterium]